MHALLSRPTIAWTNCMHAWWLLNDWDGTSHY